MNTTKQRFTVTYHITVRDGRGIKDYAQDIAIEQTVEVPYDCIPEEHFYEGIMGQIEDIEDISEDGSLYRVVISYRCDISGFAIPQLMNILFGNISLKNNIRLVDLYLPESFRSAFPGLGKRDKHGQENNGHAQDRARTTLKHVIPPLDDIRCPPSNESVGLYFVQVLIDNIWPLVLWQELR